MYIERSFPTGAGWKFQPADEALLPAAAPLAMPEQQLTGANFRRPADTEAEGMLPRRLFLVFGSSVLGVAAAHAVTLPLLTGGITLIEAGFILLFFALFAWIAFGFFGALAGFFVLLGNGPGLPRWLAGNRVPKRRTAVLMPIYNENVDAVFGRLAAMSASVAAIRAQHLFDFFVLSDSSADAEAREVAAVRRLQAQSASHIYYRRRPANIARKPGNIADWVRRFGGAYEHMIVLDADSLMSGAAMMRLAAAMEERPGIGLIQTVPTIVNGRTFFARCHQFAATAYGSVASAGLQWWSGSEATFWGHNAIIRVRAFAESCGLPLLSGREPFGGHIMSHDMVEAALLRRRGWAVHMVVLPEGSYEEFPPTLADHAVRDRRWCQGNLQHLRLLGTEGLHWVSRLQLVMGASAYLTSPLWLLLLIVGLVEPWRTSYSAFAALPAGWVIALTVFLLIGPKLIALLWLGVDQELRTSLGGGRRLIATVAIEIPLSMLVAPITMLSQTIAIIEIARGRPAGWATQRRGMVDEMTFGEALRLYRAHMAVGGLFALATLAGLSGALWTLPIAIGLLVSPAVALVTSRTDVGDYLRSKGLFLSPHDTQTALGDGKAADAERFIAETRWSRTFVSPSRQLTLTP